MKKLFLGIFFVFAATSLMAGASVGPVTYSVVSSTFTHDISQGTFVANTTTYGAVVGLTYTVSATDTISGKVCNGSGTVALVPALSFPAKGVALAAIQNDVSNSGLKSFFNACLSIQVNPTAKSASNVGDNVTGITGSAVTPP
jgi:hypothetical protein